MSNNKNNERNEKLFDAALKIATEEAMVERMEALPSREELAKLYPRSQAFDKRVAKIISKHDRVEKKNNIFAVRRYLKIAASFLLIVTLGFGLLLLNEDVRAAVRQTIIEWNEGFTSFIFQSNHNNVDAVDISDFRVTYIPDGFTENIVLETPTIVIIEFTNAIDDLIMLNKGLSEGRTLAVQNAFADHQILENDGIRYHVFVSTRYYAPSQIIWEIGEFSFLLSGEQDPDVLVKMALSLEWD